MSQTSLGFALGLIGVLIFSTTLPVTAIGLIDFSPLVMSLGRAFIAGLFAIVVITVSNYNWPVGRQWLQLTGIILGIIFGFPVFATLAMQTVPASHGGVVLGLLPLCTALCSTLLLGERPNRWFWFWAIVGASLVLTFALYDTNFSLQLGDLWLLAAIAAGSFGYTVGGGLSRDMPGWLVVSWALVLAMPVILLIFCAFPPTELKLENLRLISSNSWLALFWVAFMSQFVGFFFWNAGLAKGGVASVGQLQLFQIFFTLAFSALLLGEVIGLRTVLFAAAVFLSVAFGRRALKS